MRLQGKVAVITGGASGIGAASVSLFIREGARVVIGDIQRGPGEAFAAQFGDKAAFAVCDVTKEEQVAALVDLAVSRFGHLDIMFNNAGIVGAVGPIDTTPGAEWNLTIDILLNGVFYGMKHAARVMKPRGTGSIISMASTAGLMGGLGPHAYAAAKHAVVGLTKEMGLELGTTGIRVNAVGPGVTRTALTERYFQDPSMAETVKSVHAMNRWGEAREIARAILFLASDDASFITGTTLVVDGGVPAGIDVTTGRIQDWRPVDVTRRQKALDRAKELGIRVVALDPFLTILGLDRESLVDNALPGAVGRSAPTRTGSVAY